MHSHTHDSWQKLNMQLSVADSKQRLYFEPCGLKSETEFPNTQSSGTFTSVGFPLKKEEQKSNQEPLPAPTRIWPQHPDRGGTGGGNSQQHESRLQHESSQRATARARSENLRTCGHPVIRHRSPNQDNKGGNYGAHSTTLGVGAALQEGERLREPGARACNVHEPSPHERSPHEAPDAHAR
jgi:hypothetical protein